MSKSESDIDVTSPLLLKYFGIVTVFYILFDLFLSRTFVVCSAVTL